MTIHHDQILAKLKSYEDVMYRKTEVEDERRLRTGDVVKLELTDFEKILRNYHVLEPLLESYINNSKYKSKLWAILNKPCDMVHNEVGSQRFKANLFLCPLQSFRNELKKEHIFAEYISPPLGMKDPAEEISKIYKDFISKRAKEVYPIQTDMPDRKKREIGKERNQFIKDQKEWAWNEIFSYFEEIEKLETYEMSLKLYSKTLERENQDGEFDHILAFIGELKDIREWMDYKARYHAMIDGIDEVRINSKKTTDLVQTVFINQMETKGMFYYEPHQNLYCKELCDFSYFIELEDIITLKLNQDLIDSGELVKLLQDGRKVGLSRNFSDRLQNIMGYFFSKIGTKDVKGSDVLGIYDDCFETFYYDKESLKK